MQRQTNAVYKCAICDVVSNKNAKEFLSNKRTDEIYIVTTNPLNLKN